MDLNNFEIYIDRIIYTRGCDYFDNDAVKYIREKETNKYSAKVEGTETYTVNVELDDSLNIVDSVCSCPYDMGEFCKHQVAVFLALRDMKISSAAQDIASEGISDLKDAKSIIPVARKNKEPDIKEILSARKKEELVDFILSMSFENEELTQRILLEFDDGDDEEEIQKAVSLIRTYIRNNSDRYSFVSYRDAGSAVAGAELVLEKAQDAYENNKVIHALNLAICVVHEMVDLIQNTDDSGGIVSCVADEGFEFIDEITDDMDFNVSEKEIIFQSLIKEASHRRYADWTEWRLNFLRYASRLSDTAELRNRLEAYMTELAEREDPDSWSGRRFAEKVNQIKLDMIRENDGEQIAQEFIEQNLQFSSFRKLSIEKALQDKDHEKVIRLALEGEEKDKNQRDLADDWRGYRYTAYKLSGRLEEQRAIAMELILEGSFEYYKELKKTYSTEEWVDIYPKIIYLYVNRSSGYYGIYTKMLIEEGEKEKLLEYISKNPGCVESYYMYLIPEFSKEVYDVFKKYIEQEAARARDRRDYRNICDIISKLKKAGGGESVLEIKQKLLFRYSNRPAFRDELSKV